MPFKATPITISNRVQDILLKISKGKTLPACQVQRAKIILLAVEGLSNMEISKQVGIGQDSVSKWRHRFIKNQDLLCEIEKQDPSGLESEITTLLMDLPRSGHPTTFTDEQIIRILELACRNPTEFGYESSHWSLNQLVDVILKEGIADSISAKTVSRFLKYGENPPSSHSLLASFVRENRFTGNFYRESE